MPVAEKPRANFPGLPGLTAPPSRARGGRKRPALGESEARPEEGRRGEGEEGAGRSGTRVIDLLAVPGAPSRY